MVPVYNLSTQDARAGRSEIQGRPWLHRKVRSTWTRVQGKKEGGRKKGGKVEGRGEKDRELDSLASGLKVTQTLVSLWPCEIYFYLPFL